MREGGEGGRDKFSRLSLTTCVFSRFVSFRFVSFFPLAGASTLPTTATLPTGTSFTSDLSLLEV